MPTNPFTNPKFDFSTLTRPHNHSQLASWYYKHNINTYIQSTQNKSQEYWLKQGQTKALNLFHATAKHVPGYKDFLKKNKINPHLIKTYKDFSQVPLTDKSNYISQYPLEKLTWDGNLSQTNIVSFSSGSTGTPYFWPRNTFEDFEGSFFMEHFLVSYFQIHQRSSLFVNCFSMGNYVAGTYILVSMQQLTQKGYPLTIISPGINYQDVFSMLQKLADKFDQIILVGYPPFIKDLIDLGADNHIDWKKHHVRFLFSSEFFSESWREQVLASAGTKNKYINSTNLYGTADATIFGLETPACILLRDYTQTIPDIKQQLFKSDLTPTLVQFNPTLRHFESINNELILTSATGIPLIRYNLKDQGNILTDDDINLQLKKSNTSLEKLLNQHKLTSSHQNLPFLFLTNRTDGAVSFYGINIYPEYVSSGIEAKSLSKQLSGKFSLVSTFDKHNNPKLIVHVELNPHIKPSPHLKAQTTNSVIKSLQTHCSEYSFLQKAIKAKAKPEIQLHPKGESEYFKIGIKQKWIVK